MKNKYLITYVEDGILRAMTTYTHTIGHAVQGIEQSGIIVLSAIRLNTEGVDIKRSTAAQD